MAEKAKTENVKVEASAAPAKVAATVHQHVTFSKDFEKSPYSKEPLEKVFIPLDQGEKQGTTQPVVANGIRLNVQKGKLVEVPRTFAQIINESIQATAVAEAEAKASADPSNGGTKI